jgi:hypothetical protein
MRFLYFGLFFISISPYVSYATAHVMHGVMKEAVDSGIKASSSAVAVDEREMKTSHDYSDEAFGMLSQAKFHKAPLTHDQIKRFASLIIQALPLEGGQGLCEAWEYVKNRIPDGKALLEAAHKSGDYAALLEPIIKYETDRS